MHKIFIGAERACTAQQVADAVHFAPDKVRIESGPEIDPRAYDGPLAGLRPYRAILFSTRDGSIGQIHVTVDGYAVGELRRTQPPQQQEAN